MLAPGKLTLTSKKPRQQCLKIAPRKPVKGCYCQLSEVNNPHARSSRTRHKSASPCRHCRSELELRPIGETGDKAALISPISCETLRRVQKIDYAPRSQFLRNVQNKICELRAADQEGSRACPRSVSYHRFMTSTGMQDKKSALPGKCGRIDDQLESPTSPMELANSLASEQSGPDVACASSKRSSQVSPRKLSKSTLRKTIRSRRQIPGSSEKPASKSPLRGKRTARLCKQERPCCCRSELEKNTAKLVGDEYAEGHDLPEYCERREQCIWHDDPAAEDFVEQEVENLRKFREQNYFETHGSSHTLTSSRSSGSLQQYLLNERLFPESIGRVHKQDLVVTMPPCATTQRKRIHYFPRYVVRQEKNACNTNYRRKRCQNCPLTGHAVDLGVLKTRPPLNSLALKYQKRALWWRVIYNVVKLWFLL